MSNSQTLLTQFRNGEFKKKKIPLNALIGTLPKLGIEVYSAKINGNFTSEIPKQHIARYASNKYDFACAGYIIDGEVYLLGVEPFTAKRFIKRKTSFVIEPLKDKKRLISDSKLNCDTIAELLLNEILQQYKTMGYQVTRTSSKRHRKESMIDATKPVFSKKNRVYWFHAYEGFLIRVKLIKDDSILVILDTIYHVLRTTFNQNTSFKTMINNDGEWMSTKRMPQIISNLMLPMRKVDGRTRLKKDLELLKKIDLNLIGIDDLTPFITKDLIKLEEPNFMFGNKKNIKISDNEELSTFLLNNLRRYGIKAEISPPIRIQPIVMSQLNTKEFNIRINSVLKKLKERYEELFHKQLIILEIIYLRDSDDQVEEECNILRKRYLEEFDLVLGILKGQAYNHVYRKAIKKGLQNVPSQIVKFYLLNSPKIFKDQYAPSILSQIVFKSRGIMTCPIELSHLNKFSVRIFYDIGRFRNAPRKKPQTIVGVASLITQDEIYKFEQSSKINDIGHYETTSRRMVREIITKVIGMYLKAVGKEKVEDNILIQRDGKSNRDEYDEAKDVIALFKDSGFISHSCNWVFIEFIKNSVLRLFDYTPSFNPLRGSLLVLDETCAILTTTGHPDIHPKEKKDSYKVGVAKPIEIRRVYNSNNFAITMRDIAKDVYYRSFMWMASFNKSRNIAESNMIHELFDLRRQGVSKTPDFIC